MRTRKDLRRYQVRAALRICLQRRVGLFVDMSLGKTAITLTAIRNLIDQGKLPHGAWVIAPLTVTKDTWQQEALKWSHLKDLKFILVEGKRPAARLALLKQKADVKIISYTLLPWLGRLLKNVRKRRPGWLPDLIALDESEHIKGRGKWFRVIRYKLLKWIDYRVIQTGTPAAHSLFDIWSQIYVLDKGKRLGMNFGIYRSRFFRQADYMGFKYEPRPGAEARIYGLVRDIVVRLDGRDWLELPQIVTDTRHVDLPPRAMELYRRHEREMFIRLDNLREVEAINAAVLSNQCWQLANGAIYDDPEERTSFTEIHRAKIDALNLMIEEAVGNAVMVAYWFKHDRWRLQEAFPHGVFMNKDNIVDVKDRWNKGKIPLLFVSPSSSSYGLNMQYGGHILIWFSQIWSGGKHAQLIARLVRPDQRSPHVISRYISARDTVDEVIEDSRVQRLEGQAAFLDALRRYRKRRM